MAHVSLDTQGLKQFVNANELGEMQAMVNAADEELRKLIAMAPAQATGPKYCQRCFGMLLRSSRSGRPAMTWRRCMRKTPGKCLSSQVRNSILSAGRSSARCN